MADTDSTKSPAFQFYPKDFLSDENVRVMSLQECGAYIRLIALCWIEGTLPVDTERLARLVGVPLATFRKIWPALDPCFRAHPTNSDRLIHPRLEREREKQENFRRRQSDNGRRGGRPKKPEESHEKAMGFETESGGFSRLKPNQSQPGLARKSSSSSVCDLQSSSAEREKDTHAERAGNFIEAYRELHQRYRGVAYLGNPVQDYQQAQYLVGAFDDAMLEKLAVYWLNDTDDFASNGTRSLAKLRSRASKYAEELKALKLA